MYCPKCKQKFEEGSRRFCPTDGARLISEESEGAGRQQGGVFANLIPKMEGLSELGQQNASANQERNIQKQAPRVLDEENENLLFFDLDEDEPEVTLQPDEQYRPPVMTAPAQPSSRPPARKVNPANIPAGHVKLDERPADFNASVDHNNPEGFVGRTVKGRYKVTEFLGGDETCLAYLADDQIITDKKVLVRILNRAESDDILDSILAEERVSLSHFTHPNVARVVDSGQFTNGVDFLVSEYIDALSVRDILGIHGQFSETRTARVIRQVASALNEANQEGILHRDLRPENIILDSSSGEVEQPILVNFGGSDGSPNQVNQFYKAPEVLDGRAPTSASEIFSLAVVAYEMLTGKLPFNGTSPKELIRSQHDGVKSLVSSVRPTLSPAVDDVFDKAFSFRPAGRFTKPRDFGDALASALTEKVQKRVVEVPPIQAPAPPPPAAAEPKPAASAAPVHSAVPTREEAAQILASIDNVTPTPAASAVHEVPTSKVEPAWKNRSPEPPEEGSSSKIGLAAAGFAVLLTLLALGWYFLANQSPVPNLDGQGGATNSNQNSTIASSTEMPPLPRSIAQPPNTTFYQNSKQNLKGDLLLNFVGFTLYYPKDWKVNGPQNGDGVGRGKFLDISRNTPDGRLREQMLISYYPSKGTFTADAERFPILIKETNETLKKLLPGYEMVSEGEIKVNGDWRAYEMKFRAGGKAVTGDRLEVWGRRIYIPAARPGTRNGFEITMLATSLADDVRSVDDVGVKGELAPILYSFEPSQNF